MILKPVSMKSGLDGRNNVVGSLGQSPCNGSLNEVRPRWPEQYALRSYVDVWEEVSMKSGLDGRNNWALKFYIQQLLAMSQ